MFKPGAIPNPPDKRDIILGKITPKIDIPESYETDPSLIKTMWQNGYPMCGSHAAAVFKAWLDALEAGESQHYSPVYLWKKIKAIDGFAPEDGTYMRAIFKVLMNTGACDYDLLPTDYSESLKNLSKEDTTKEQNLNAHPRIIKSYAQDSGDIELLKQNIYLYKVVLVIADVGDTWWGKSLVYPMKKKDGGHFFVAYGYDKDGVMIVDSADKEVPFKKLTNDYVIREIGTAIDMPNWQVKAMTSQIEILKKIVELLLKLKAMKIKWQKSY